VGICFYNLAPSLPNEASNEEQQIGNKGILKVLPSNTVPSSLGKLPNTALRYAFFYNKSKNNLKKVISYLIVICRMNQNTCASASDGLNVLERKRKSERIGAASALIARLYSV
jgi:hypothetical protein